MYDDFALLHCTLLIARRINASSLEKSMIIAMISALERPFL